MENNETTVTRNEIPEKVRQIFIAASRTLATLRTIRKEDDLLFRFKFSSMGTKWDDPEQPDDFGEQIQQSMTMLTTYYAVDWFCRQLIPENKPVFTINGGDKNGPDISFENSHGIMMLCEVFAANDPYGNNKIFHDLKVIAKRKQECENGKKILPHIAFCSPIPLNGARRACKKEGIVITDFRDRYVCTDISYEFAGTPGHSARVIHVTPRELQQWVEKMQGYPFRKKYR